VLEALLSAIRILSNGSVKALKILGAFQRLRVRELRTPLQLPDQALYAKYYTLDSEGQKITVEKLAAHIQGLAPPARALVLSQFAQDVCPGETAMIELFLRLYGTADVTHYPDLLTCFAPLVHRIPDPGVRRRSGAHLLGSGCRNAGVPGAVRRLAQAGGADSDTP
jgi:hypothetical protein